MSQDPNILVTVTGPQFLTAPDGTTAPDVAGDPVDLTGVPLTVAPSYAEFTGDVATIDGAAFGLLGVGNLLPGNLTPNLAGKRLSLVGAQEGNAAGVTHAFPAIVAGVVNMTDADVGRFFVVKGAVNPGNNGVFPITQVVSATVIIIDNPAAVVEAPLTWRRSDFFNGFPSPVDTNTGNAGIFDIGVAPIPPVPVTPTTIAVVDAAGMFPDAWSGEILWQVLPALTDFPAGDPLTYIAEQPAIPLNIVTDSGPQRFGDYDPTLPPLVVNDSSGVFSKVQRS